MVGWLVMVGRLANDGYVVIVSILRFEQGRLMVDGLRFSGLLAIMVRLIVVKGLIVKV